MRKYILTEHEEKQVIDYLEFGGPASPSLRSLRRRARQHLNTLKVQMAMLEDLIKLPEVDE